MGSCLFMRKLCHTPVIIVQKDSRGNPILPIMSNVFIKETILFVLLVIIPSKVDVILIVIFPLYMIRTSLSSVEPVALVLLGKKGLNSILKEHIREKLLLRQKHL